MTEGRGRLRDWLGYFGFALVPGLAAFCVEHRALCIGLARCVILLRLPEPC